MDKPPLRLLLVEDEPNLRRALARSLAARGHQIVECGTHEEAMLALSKADHDLLLLDINLPDATGWDVLRDLAVQGRHIPAVIFSAAPPNPKRLHEFKPLAVLYKPFPIDALIRLVQEFTPGESPRRAEAARELHA